MYAPDDTREETREYERRLYIYAFEYMERMFQGLPFNRDSQQRLDQLYREWGLREEHVAAIESRIYADRNHLRQLLSDIGRLQIALSTRVTECLYPIERPIPGGNPSPLQVVPLPAPSEPPSKPPVTEIPVTEIPVTEINDAVKVRGRSPLPWLVVFSFAGLSIGGWAFFLMIRPPLDPPSTTVSPPPSPTPTATLQEFSASSPPSPAAEPSPPLLEPSPPTSPIASQTPADVVRDRLQASGLSADFFNQLHQTVTGANDWETMAPPEKNRSAHKLLDALEQGLTPQALGKLGQYDSMATRQLATRQKALSPSAQFQKEIDAVTDRRFFQLFPTWKGRKLQGTGLDQVWVGILDDVLTAKEQQRL